MRHRKDHALAVRIFAGEGTLRFVDFEPHRAADEFQAGIADQGAGQKPGFDQHLKAVADAQHEAAPAGIWRSRPA